MASGQVFVGWWGTSPSGFPIGPQSSVDTEALRDQQDEELLQLKRQQRRLDFEAKWANAPGPDTWKRVR
ncbi:hypothetical protein [Candidatus Nephthysia bennettiae]|uniref:Uncharacterized protein n=1 Tax=Candidatus Nephthysia bennettiae TaxID=3127016 RepID=A0A934K6H7_9BACT|nr:hypothetical protein [Candidatus Dormibacteraeota bacterium]